MVTEIKVFLLTKILYAMYEDELTVLDQLREILDDSPFWEQWFERYHQIRLSKPTQILLMREAGMTYRKIQKTVGVSATTVQQTLQQLDLDYDALKYSEPITEALRKLEIKIKKHEVELW